VANPEMRGVNSKTMAVNWVLRAVNSRMRGLNWAALVY
jgi:hypothetical protein